MERINIKEQLVLLLKDAKAEVKGFNKKNYDEKFNLLYKKYAHVVTDIEQLYGANEDMELLDDLATAFAYYLKEELVEVKKRQKEVFILDHNMAMVIFVLPLLGKSEEKFMSVFQNKCVDQWNLVVPKNKIQNANKSDIDSGFKAGWCYITTAVCESMDRPDDCYELNLFRNFRDNYLLATTDGELMVQKYYDIAPTIVKRIDKEENAKEIYNQIWEEYLSVCIRTIEAGDNIQTKEIYSNMVETLASEYFN